MGAPRLSFTAHGPLSSPFPLRVLRFPSHSPGATPCSPPPPPPHLWCTPSLPTSFPSARAFHSVNSVHVSIFNMTRFGQLALLAALVLASSAQALSPSHGTVEDSLDPRMRTRSELDAPGMPPSFQALPAPVVPDVAGFVPESNTSSGGAVVRRSSRSRALAKRGSTGAGHLIKKRGRKCKVWKSDAARE